MRNNLLDFKLKNNTILIAGGFRGIGLELAKLLVMCNSRIILVGKTKKNEIEALKILKKISPKAKINCETFDLYNENQRKLLYKKIKKNYPSGIDHLVSFLGTGKTEFKATTAIKIWKDIFDKNLFSIIDLVNLFLPILKKSKKEKSIIITSAVAGLERLNAPTSYSCAKASLSTYISHLAHEVFKFNLRVIAVNPGNVFYKGGRWEEIIAEQGIKKIKNNVLNDITMKRLGKPSELAWNYLSLMSPRNSFMTGTNIIIDGQQIKKTI